MEKWLTNPTCIPPCLEGITPGISTAKEAVDKRFLLSDVKRTSSPYYDEKAVGFEHGCEWVNFYSDDTSGLVKAISVYIGCDKDNTTVKEIIGVYGNPDYAYATWQEYGCDRHYVWLETGMEIIGYKERALFSFFKPVDPEMLVSTISFFDPNRGQDLTAGGSIYEKLPFTSIENDPCEN